MKDDKDEETFSTLWTEHLEEEHANKSTESRCPICGGQLSPLSRYVQAMKYKNWYICTRERYDLFWDPEKHKWYALVPLDRCEIVKKEKSSRFDNIGPLP